MALRQPNQQLAAMTPYDPKYLPAQVQVSANESTLDVPEEVRTAAMARLANVAFNRYGDCLHNDLRDALAAREGVRRDQVLVGDGGDELLFDIALAWCGGAGALLNIPPTFGSLSYDCELLGAPVVEVPRGEGFAFPAREVIERVGRGDVGCVLVTNPNNPTGDLQPVSFIDELCAATDALVLVDEAYIEFAPDGSSCVPLLERHDNLAILRTMSKLYGLAGVRIGYLLAGEHIITELMKVRQPYSVSMPDAAIALEAVLHTEAYNPRLHETRVQRERLAAALAQLPGVEVFPSVTNFLLVRVAGAHEVWQRMLERGVLVRDFSGGALTRDCLRVSVGTPAEVDATIAAFRAAIGVE